MGDKQLDRDELHVHRRPWRGPRSKLLLVVGVTLITVFQLTSKFFHAPRLTPAVDDAVNRPFQRKDQVQFDRYSLILKGQRVFIHSGEFHTWRLPVPSLWPDILEKTKAAGLNAISIYVHMGLSNPAREVIDFDGFRALKPLYEACMAAGIWVVVRPGPYINAETSAGGIAHWITTEVAGRLRTNDSDWSEAWRPYIDAVVKETAPYQIHRGGPVIAVQIDNEYTQHVYGHGEYYEELLAAFRDGGIEVPLTYNDPDPGENFINGTGAVDLYGMDSYPQRFDCSHPSVWNPVVPTYHQYHERVNPSQPWYIPEFQGGSFDAWGPSAPGYAPCAQLTGPDFLSVFNMHLWASNAKLINYYMLYGGTTWGGLPFPGVYTSYDYGAAIAESRALTPKYDELKLQGMFIRSSPVFAKTDWVADSHTGLTVSSNSAVFVTHLRNPDSGTSFWIARQNDSSSTGTASFSLHIPILSVQGSLTIPLAISSLVLGGREAKTIVTDYAFGTRADSLLAYSTARIFFAGTMGERDVLLLHGRADQAHEFAMHMTGVPNPWFTQHETAFTTLDTGSELGTVVSVLPGTADGLVTVHDSDTQLVLFADSEAAATFWAPTISNRASAPFENFWGIGTNQSVLVGGPYLVRSASLQDDGTTLALTGDLSEEVRLTLIVPPSVQSVSWNGISLGAPDSLHSNYSVKTYLVPTRLSLSAVSVPELSGWRFADSLPEVTLGADFDDSKWVLADHTETNIPEKPWYGDGRVLYGCDYGFCENVVLWRGHFNLEEDNELPTSVNLSINGGEAFAASVWLNSAFLGTSYGNSTNNMNIIEETDDKFLLPAEAQVLGDNVITIVQDNMGLNETQDSDPETSKNPRGLRGYALDRGTFGDWKVQGKVGGYLGFPDKTRGLFNEGGLFGERRGWHLPGFDTSNWSSRDLALGLPGDTAGVGFFVTTLELNIEPSLDVHVSFEFEDAAEVQPYRALLFVNGWNMGKRVANLGPQYKFPVHQGILDYRGKNTIAVALWSMENVPVSPRLRVAVDGVYDSALSGVVTNNPDWKASAAGRM
ncbi:BetaGal-dom2 domain-containing protein [Mycena chlorophos]|uniref:beta-galactosidase n=1 Tax=Mycena chlorophos TaxID=658473 RepID=A0A8H6SHI7_MYCCL|nr:BetaGal-dom2 domain-containing protein [Mycena chlorophos]